MIREEIDKRKLEDRFHWAILLVLLVLRYRRVDRLFLTDHCPNTRCLAQDLEVALGDSESEAHKRNKPEAATNSVETVKFLQNRGQNEKIIDSIVRQVDSSESSGKPEDNNDKDEP